jgi:hypothetical protein
MPKLAADDPLASISGSLAAQTGRHDLCLLFTRGQPDPYWALHDITLVPGRQ